MEYREFVRNVQDRTQLERDQATKAVQATLQTLAERITKQEAADLAAQLPQELKSPLREQGVLQKYDLQGFLKRISEREGCSEQEALEHARAVFQTLCEAVSHGEMTDVMSQLPKDFQKMFACGIQTRH
jgi:uncharacterized protein (DUF2267 family)